MVSRSAAILAAAATVMAACDDLESAALGEGTQEIVAGTEDSA